MVFRKRIVRKTMGKEAIKKSATLLAVIGPSTNPVTSFPLIEVPVRNTVGQQSNIRDVQTTDVDANVGDIVKYINVRIQTGPTDATPEDDTSGWLEWSVVKYRELVTPPSNNQLGVRTLADVCTKMFRGDHLLNGAIPVGGDQPSVQDIVVAIPKVAIKMQLGSSIVLYVHFRSTNNASVSTDLNDVILGTQYKLYV